MVLNKSLQKRVSSILEGVRDGLQHPYVVQPHMFYSSDTAKVKDVFDFASKWAGFGDRYLVLSCDIRKIKETDHHPHDVVFDSILEALVVENKRRNLGLDSRRFSGVSNATAIAYDFVKALKQLKGKYQGAVLVQGGFENVFKNDQEFGEFVNVTQGFQNSLATVGTPIGYIICSPYDLRKFKPSSWVRMFVDDLSDLDET